MRLSRQVAILFLSGGVTGALAACSGRSDPAPSISAAVTDAASPASATSLRASSVASKRGEPRYYEGTVWVNDGLPHPNLHRQTDASGKVVEGGTVPGGGLTPQEMLEMYNIPSGTGPSPTIAIVDFGDDPNAEADLGVYRAQYGLSTCSTANGCFTKVNANGASSPLPPAAPQTPTSGQSDQALEIMVDLQMASAICPTCKLLLIEETSGSDIPAGWATAVANATFVSNSWGLPDSVNGADTSVFQTYESMAALNQAGVSFFASAGDSAYGASWPATSSHMTAVGGSEVVATSSPPWWSQSTLWPQTGAGCSASIAKPSWQSDPWCGGFRTANDVAGLAGAVGVSPALAPNVYNSWSSAGWTITSGTSIASPLVAAVYAMNGWNGATPAYSYANSESFEDISSGVDNLPAGSTPPAYTQLDKAGIGYDAPTGNGYPVGSASYNDTFTITPNAITLPAGGSISPNVQIVMSGTWVDNSTSGVTYGLGGLLPAGLTASLQSSGTQRYIALGAAASLKPGSYPLTLSGTAWNVTHEISFTVNVTTTDAFSFAPNPLSVAAGACGSAEIVTGSWASGGATFSVNGNLVPSMSASIAGTAAAPTVSFCADGTVPAQSVTYTVTASAGDGFVITAPLIVDVTKCIAQTLEVACEGRTCGPYEDDCGNAVNCGTCTNTSEPYCSAAGSCTACPTRTCVAPEFWDPETCSCKGCECGEIRLDGKLVCAACLR